MCDEGGGEQQHVVVGKLVRHRTDKWLRLNREKSAFFDRHVAIDEHAFNIAQVASTSGAGG